MKIEICKDGKAHVFRGVGATTPEAKFRTHRCSKCGLTRQKPTKRKTKAVG